ncbi:MAG: hypothetical protein U0168_07910 [Nannocystaceae bacterium]
MDNDFSAMRAVAWEVFDGLIAGKAAADAIACARRGDHHDGIRR